MQKENFDPTDIAGMAINLNQDKLKSDIDLEHVDDDFLFDNPGVDKTSDIDADIEEIQQLFRDMDTNSISNNKLNNLLDKGNESDSSIMSNLSDDNRSITNIGGRDDIGIGQSSGRPTFNISSTPATSNTYSNTYSPNYTTGNSYSNNTFKPKPQNHTFRYKNEDHHKIEGALDRQKRVNEVMLTFADDNQPDFIELEKKAEEDNKYVWLSEIDELKGSIKAYGQKIDNIPEVGVNSSPEDIYNTHQLLLYKYDCATSWGMIEEAIEMGAEGVEWIFNGKRDMFGSKPDASGFKRNTSLKLRKLRYKSSKAIKRTSSAASSEGGLWTALAWELIPSLVFQIRANGKKKSEVDEIQEGLTNISMYN